MRAIVCKALGDVSDLVVEDVPTPPLGPDAVRIAVEAAGVNFADTLIIAGKYQIRPSPPFTPGFEVAGRVLECAAGVSRCRPGDRVMAVIEYGGFAEEVVATQDCVFVLPDGIDPVVAAGFPVAYGTSHLGLKYKAGLASGETLARQRRSGRRRLDRCRDRQAARSDGHRHCQRWRKACDRQRSRSRPRLGFAHRRLAKRDQSS